MALSERELARAVATLTGESVWFIKRMGFCEIEVPPSSRPNGQFKPNGRAANPTAQTGTSIPANNHPYK